MAHGSLIERAFVDPDALVGLLDELRTAGYRIGTTEYIAAQDLVLALAAHRMGADDPDRLESYLRPLLCSSAREQAEFHAYFDRWRSRLLPTRGVVPSEGPPEDRTLDEELTILVGQTRRVRWIGYGLAATIGVIALGWLLLRVPPAGVLDIVTQPAGAVVRLIPRDTPQTDTASADTSRTPSQPIQSPVQLSLDAGSYRVALQLNDYKDTTVVRRVVGQSVLQRLFVGRPPIDTTRLRALEHVQLAIASRPGGAQVHVESAPVLRTPVAIGRADSLTLIEGRHRVRLVLAGYRQVDTAIVLSPGPPARLDVSFVPAQRVNTRFASYPTGATVTVDGRLLGRAPFGRTLDEGPHEVGFSLAGHQDFVAVVHLARDSTVAVTLNALRPLRVTSIPDSAQVFVDNVPMGVTPAALRVTEGTHDLRFERTGHEPVAQRITVLGLATTAFAELEPLQRPFMRVAFLRGRRWLAAGDPYRGMRLWDPVSFTTGDEEVADIPLPRPATGIGPMVRDASMRSGTWTHGLTEHVALNQDRTRALVSTDSSVTLRRQFAGAEPVDTILVAHAPITSVAMNLQGDVLAAGDSRGTVRLWRTAPEIGSALNEPIGNWNRTIHRGEVNAIAVSDDGLRLASAGADSTVVLWDTDALRPLDTLRHTDVVEGVTFQPGSHVLVTSERAGVVRFWGMPRGRTLTALGFLASNWLIALSLALLPLPAWVIRRLWRARAEQVLVRRTTNELPRLERVALARHADAIFASLPLFRTAVRLRRRVTVPDFALDVGATVEATIARGGLFTPAFGVKHVQPEYLALIDRRSNADQQSAYVDELIDRLVSDGVNVTRFYFDGDPRVCFPSSGKGAPLSLRVLTQQYAEHRLLLFSDARHLFSPVTGEAEPWTETLLAWERRALFTPEPMAFWGERERALVEELGVYEADADGLAMLASSRAGAVAAIPDVLPETRTPMPAALQRRPRRWIERDALPEEEVDAMVIQLRAYLGASGFLWLAACAVYPELHWRLTLNLGQAVPDSEGRPLLEADRLLAMSRLPWFRHGRMPDWLRTRLLRELVPRDERRVRAILESLLVESAKGSHGPVILEVADRNTGALHALGRALLNRIRARVPATHPLRDYVFIEFMHGRRPEPLAVRLPRALRGFMARRGHRSSTNLSNDPNPIPPRLLIAMGATIVFFFVAPLGWLSIPIGYGHPTQVGAVFTPNTAERVVAPPVSAPRDFSTTESAALVSSPTYGFEYGTPFRQECRDVSEIRVQSGAWIHAIQLVCREREGVNGVHPSAGGSGGAADRVVLRPGARITAVSGSFDGAQPVVYSLAFEAIGRVWTFGDTSSQGGRQRFRIEVPTGTAFAGIVGRSGEFLHRFGILHTPLRARTDTVDTSATRPPLPTGACYWMSPQGSWVPRPDLGTKEGCKRMDSCAGGLGESGGGCYKWATSIDRPAEPWSSCYWLRPSGGWVPMRDLVSKQSCYEMDSCSGGLAQSGGGCYKWASDSLAVGETLAACYERAGNEAWTFVPGASTKQQCFDLDRCQGAAQAAGRCTKWGPDALAPGQAWDVPTPMRRPVTSTTVTPRPLQSNLQFPPSVIQRPLPPALSLSEANGIANEWAAAINARSLERLRQLNPTLSRVMSSSFTQLFDVSMSLVVELEATQVTAPDSGTVSSRFSGRYVITRPDSTRVDQPVTFHARLRFDESRKVWRILAITEERATSIRQND